jgi:lysophospholipase L1-like esterase
MPQRVIAQALLIIGLGLWSEYCLLSPAVSAPQPETAGQAAPPPTTPENGRAAAVNSAVVPSLNQRFMRRHDEFVEIAKKGEIDVLFIGDSITDWWRNEGRGRRGRGGQPLGMVGAVENRANAGKAIFDQHFGSWNVANFGIAGDTTQGVLWRLQNGEGQGFEPKAVMLMIGTNNTRANTAEQIADGIKAVVAELRKDFPNAKILLLGIFPRSNPDDPVRTKIHQINTIIAQLHDGEHVTYMDIGEKFLAEDGAIPRDVMVDGLHPTTKGYAIWAEAVTEQLTKMMDNSSASR